MLICNKNVMDQRRCGVGAFCKYLRAFIHVWAKPQKREDHGKQTGSSDGSGPNTHRGSRGSDNANGCYAGPKRATPRTNKIYTKNFSRLGREPINLQGVRLAKVRYAPITTKLRSAEKCRDGSNATDPPRRWCGPMSAFPRERPNRGQVTNDAKGQRATSRCLLNHLVGRGEQRGWNG